MSYWFVVVVSQWSYLPNFKPIDYLNFIETLKFLSYNHQGAESSPNSHLGSFFECYHVEVASSSPLPVSDL
jgi:hypothetical protein